MLKYFVYVLFSTKSSKYYVGYTSDFAKRLAEHNRGKVSATKAYLPYSLAHLEEFPDKRVARLRELFLKTGKGRVVLNKLVKNT